MSVALFEYSETMCDDCIPEKTTHLKYYKYMLMGRSFTTPAVFSQQLMSILSLFSSKCNEISSQLLFRSFPSNDVLF